MADASELTCRQLIRLVSDYLEGTLPALERERFEAHLRTCEGCSRYVEQMRVTIRVAGTLTEESMDPVAIADLLQAFRNWSRE